MSEEINIQLSGVVLSTILFEIERSLKNNQYGFLYGHISENTVKSVTDAEMENVKISKYVNILGIYVIDEIVFDYTGQLLEEKLMPYLDDMPNIVGWFHSRKNTNLKLTLREKLMHKALFSIVNIPMDLFTCCIISSSQSDNMATHTSSEAFFRYNYTKFVQIPVQISNLGEPFDLYRTNARKKGKIDEIVQEVKSKITSDDYLNIAAKLESGIGDSIQKQIDELNELEAELRLLREDDNDLLNDMCSNVSQNINEQLTPKGRAKKIKSTESTTPKTRNNIKENKLRGKKNAPIVANSIKK